MHKNRHGLGLLGLLAVVALGVMAFASSAQALTPEFLVNKKKPGDVSVGGIQVGTGTLLIPALNVEIQCAGFKVEQGLILSGTDADASLLYEKCEAFSIKPLEKLTECHIIATPTNFVLHITASALLLPVEFASGDFGILAEKIVAKVFTLKGTECVLPIESKITGEACFLIDDNDAVEPTVLSSEAIQKSCPEKVLEALGDPAGTKVKDKLLFGAQESFIDGSAKLFVTGAEKGKATLGVSLQ